MVERTLLNASHGSIGGTPGYNPDLVSPPNGGYVYATDRDNSILSDMLIRTGMRASGFSFVPGNRKRTGIILDVILDDRPREP